MPRGNTVRRFSLIALAAMGAAATVLAAMPTGARAQAFVTGAQLTKVHAAGGHAG